MKNLLRLLKFAIRYIWESVDNALRSTFGVPKIKTSQITPNLYVGGQYQAERLYYLKDWGITGVVNMRTHTTKADFEKYKIEYLNIRVKDKSAPTQKQIKKGVKFINKHIKKGGKVYVHCRWGRGRGPTMAAAYLISNGLSGKEALELIKRTRSFIRLSRSQKQALKNFESSLRKKE